MIDFDKIKVGDTIYLVDSIKATGRRIEKEFEGETWFRFVDEPFETTDIYKSEVMGICRCTVEGVVDDYDPTSNYLHHVPREVVLTNSPREHYEYIDVGMTCMEKYASEDVFHTLEEAKKFASLV